jgi:hypothetical protein
MHWFFAMDHAGRRADSQESATNFADVSVWFWYRVSLAP